MLGVRCTDYQLHLVESAACKQAVEAVVLLAGIVCCNVERVTLALELFNCHQQALVVFHHAALLLWGIAVEQEREYNGNIQHLVVIDTFVDHFHNLLFLLFYNFLYRFGLCCGCRNVEHHLALELRLLQDGICLYQFLYGYAILLADGFYALLALHLVRAHNHRLFLLLCLEGGYKCRA